MRSGKFFHILLFGFKSQYIFMLTIRSPLFHLLLGFFPYCHQFLKFLLAGIWWENWWNRRGLVENDHGKLQGKYFRPVFKLDGLSSAVRFNRSLTRNLWSWVCGDIFNGASYTVNQTCFVVRSSVTKNHLKQTRGELIGGVKFIYLLRR